MITGLLNKLYVWLGVAGAVIVAVAVAFLKGRKAGKEDVVTTINKQERKVDAQLTKVDAQRPDLDAALGRLRKRNTEHKP